MVILTHFLDFFYLRSLILVVSFCALFNIKLKTSIQFKRNEIVHVCVYIVINSNKININLTFSNS